MLPESPSHLAEDTLATSDLLSLRPANYLTIANEQFNHPANPGILHPNIPAGSTAAQIGELTRQHQAGIKIWTKCQNTDTALKNLLISTVDEQFIKSLHNRNTGYVTSTTWDINLISFIETTETSLLPNLLKIHPN
jgi:hypothetical protein